MDKKVNPLLVSFGRTQMKPKRRGPKLIFDHDKNVCMVKEDGKLMRADKTKHCLLELKTKTAEDRERED